MATKTLNIAETRTDLKGIITSTSTSYVLYGDSTIGDIPAILYRYDASDTRSADDFPYFIKPNGLSGNGGWVMASMWYHNRTMASRSLDTSYQPSADYNILIHASISIQVTSVLVGNNGGTVFLETSPDNSTWTTISQVGLEISGVVSTEKSTFGISGLVPKNYYIRLRTSTTGTNGATIILLSTEEISI